MPKKVLLTSVCQPLGPAHGDGPSVGYELLFGQVTRAQGMFSPRATHLQFSLEYIGQNLDSPVTVLQYPTKRKFIKELKKGYDYVGLPFILSTFHRMKEMTALIREHAPQAKIVLGGYGTVLSDEELKPHCDFICREEGVAFMRRLLGEPERPLPYEHPLIVSTLKVFSLPVSKTGMIFGGLGCANGCDFCCTSHFFKRKHIRLLETGRDIYDVMVRYQEEKGVRQFTVLDEDFLLNKRRAMEFHKIVMENQKTFSIFAFASIKALSQYSCRELAEMGIDGLWIGYEGTRSGYEKQQGRSVGDLFPDLKRHGILVLSSMIVGFDYQDREVIRAELRGLLRLRPALSQFLIYGPTPGTPFYTRMEAEGRMRPVVTEDREKYFRNCTGFTSMVTHPTLSAADIEGAQRECFEEDYQRLGPSIIRSLRVWLSGYETLRRSESVALRRKAKFFADDIRRAYPILLACRLFAPNPRIRNWVGALERRLHLTMGLPTLWEQALAFLAVGAALWTRFTLNFDWFQHPSPRLTRYHWEYFPAKVMRLLGEIREGSANELRVRWQARTAGGVSWIHLEGALDGKTGEQLGRRMRESLERGRQNVVVSLEKLQFIDRKGLAAFYRASRRYRARMKVMPPAALPTGSPDLRRLVEYFTGPTPKAESA
ncbi:MAG: hypothetical protein A2X36_10870 [Elusimicrobia bacterium GWA2_69_24]|nr:MAG: hypothetical protein A2X36_10870 [Elusimicrobia bacterium GWA2_69_24]HBL18365.1 hypothetical protein [Elusimicrobiota bacterium]